MFACLQAGRSRGVVLRVREMPGVPDDAAGLRAANARQWELLAERDADRGAERGDSGTAGGLHRRRGEV